MNIQALLQDYIVNELSAANSPPELDPDVSLISSGILDSMAVFQLVAFIEEQFNVIVDDSEVSPDNFESINSIKIFLEKKMQNR